MAIPTDIRAGVYRHYRGQYYLILGLAHHSETMEPMIVYVPLYVAPGLRLCVRPVELFFDVVGNVCPNCARSHQGIGTEQRDDGWYCGVCRAPYTPSIKRFEYIGPEMPEKGGGDAASNSG